MENKTQDHAALAALKNLEAESHRLSIDEMRRRLELVFKGMVVRSPVLDPGTFLYRARCVDAGFGLHKPMKLSDLSHPPPQGARANRANRAGHPMFYGSTAKEPLYYEIGDLKAGDEIVLTSWWSRAEILLNNIGYTKAVFDSLGAKRICPEWKGNEPASPNGSLTFSEGNFEALKNRLPPHVNDLVRLEISRLFMQNVNVTDADAYKLTAAIAEAHLGTISNAGRQFSGILYPSVKMSGNGDNVALTPEFVRTNLEFKRATRIRIDQRAGDHFDISSLDCARSFDEGGNLKWLGSLPPWSLLPGQTASFVATPGKDSDGEYELGDGGRPLHWVVTDVKTGDVIEIDDDRS